MISQIHFEFKDWETCFATWKRNVELYGNDLQLVVSTHPYTSGYWIEERGKDVEKTDIVYTGEDVLMLECRIKTEIDSAEKEGRSPRFTI